jgi:hypothetical protein
MLYLLSLLFTILNIIFLFCLNKGFELNVLFSILDFDWFKLLSFKEKLSLLFYISIIYICWYILLTIIICG